MAKCQSSLTLAQVCFWNTAMIILWPVGHFSAKATFPIAFKIFKHHCSSIGRTNDTVVW